MKNFSKIRLKRIYIPTAGFLAAIIIFVFLLLYKPGRIEHANQAPDGQVNPYLTHELLPQFYNGVHAGEPFELVVEQDGLNAIIAHAAWSDPAGGIKCYSPQVFFSSDYILLTGLAALKNVEFAVTIGGNITFNENGMLNFNVDKVLIGTVPSTFVVKSIAQKILREKLSSGEIDINNIGVKMANSLLENEPFEPVFEVDDIFGETSRKVRIEKVNIDEKRITIGFMPVSQH